MAAVLYNVLFCYNRQTQLDAQLLESGRLMEASKSLVEWLEKSEESLSDKHPIRGDQDTVTSLIEQHKVRLNLLPVTICCVLISFIMT